MSAERQNTFGQAAAADLFLGGTGAGLFLISFILDLINGYEPLARIGAVTGPVLALFAALILFAELGVKSRVYMLLRNPSSWMARGTAIIAVFVVFGLAYSLPAFWQLQWTGTTQGITIGVVAAISAVMTSIYPGFLFAAAKRVSFWNTAALPPFFFSSSLYGGMAVLLLIVPLVKADLNSALGVLVIAEVILIIIQLAVLGTLLETARLGSAPVTESARILRSPSVIYGVLGGGLIMPLGLLGYYAAADGALALPILAGIFLLVGNFFLRYYTLRAGIRIPVYP